MDIVLSVATLKFANDSFGGLAGGSIDSSKSLEEAKRILEILRKRNFTDVMTTSKREKESALNATKIADELKKQAVTVADRASKFNNTFKDLLEAFRNLKKESRMAKANGMNATSLVNMAKAIDYKVNYKKVSTFRPCLVFVTRPHANLLFIVRYPPVCKFSV